MAKVYGARLIWGLSVFLIIYNLSFHVVAEIQESERYDVSSRVSNLGSYSKIEIRKLRERRDAPTDLKNQYQSISANVTDDKLSQPDGSQAGQAASLPVEQSVVVPYNSNDRLFVVNGTGQRKNISDIKTTGIKTTIVSDPIAANTATATNATAVKPNTYPKKTFSTSLAAAVPDSQANDETSAEQVIDRVDVPENETISAIEKNNFTVNETTDHHSYYNSTIYVNEAEANQTWNLIKNISHNSMLSQSHRRAMTVELSFDFPFYGHAVRNVTVATGGFLYTGEYVHSWLAATQYIAPLMANFDTSIADDSYVRLNDNGTAFTVVWENVSLQDKQDVGKFTFSATLHKNGDIVFTYFSVPIFVNAIQDDRHPVKVGLSDAYIIDKVVYFARRKTIYEYHRINFANAEITNSTIIYLKALPTCLSYTDCESCINHSTSFDCAWCPVLNRCSTGTDRKKQEWLQKGCDRAQITDNVSCPALGQKGNNAKQSNNESPQAANANSSNNSNNNNNNGDSGNNSNDSLHPFHPSDFDSATIKPVNASRVSAEASAALNDHTEPKSVGLALGFLVPICLVVTIMLWVFYAYRNPHTKSGQLLIQYRPSQWSWRRGEARYTAATIHM